MSLKKKNVKSQNLVNNFNQPKRSIENFNLNLINKKTLKNKFQFNYQPLNHLFQQIKVKLHQKLSNFKES